MDKLLLILKIALLISLLILFSVSLFLAKTNCEECNFELEGKQIDVNKFMQLYSEKCIYPYKNPSLPGLMDLNISGMNLIIVGGCGV